MWALNMSHNGWLSWDHNQRRHCVKPARKNVELGTGRICPLSLGFEPNSNLHSWRSKPNQEGHRESEGGRRNWNCRKLNGDGRRLCTYVCMHDRIKLYWEGEGHHRCPKGAISNGIKHMLVGRWCGMVLGRARFGIGASEEIRGR